MTVKSEKKNDQFSHEIRFRPSLTVLTYHVFIIWRDISRWNLSIKKKRKKIFCNNIRSVLITNVILFRNFRAIQIFVQKSTHISMQKISKLFDFSNIYLLHRNRKESQDCTNMRNRIEYLKNWCFVIMNRGNEFEMKRRSMNCVYIFINRII